MAPRNVVASWSAAAALLACTAVAWAGPVIVPEELLEEVVVVEEPAESTTVAAATTPDPKLTLNLPQIPDEILKHTLISSTLLLELGALDTDSDEDIDLNSGTTLKPVPHLTVAVLPGSLADQEQKAAKAEAEAEAEATTVQSEKAGQAAETINDD